MHILTAIRRVGDTGRHIACSIGAFIVAMIPATSFAAVFDGGGLLQGLGIASGGVRGLAQGNIRLTVTRILIIILNWMALIATIMVIIAGIYLILSLGEEERKEKAKKIVQYTLTGLAVILFARILVGLVTVVLAGIAT